MSNVGNSSRPSPGFSSQTRDSRFWTRGIRRSCLEEGENVLIFEKIRSKINDTNSFFFLIMNFALFRLNSNSIFTFQMRLEILDAGCVSNILIFPRNGEFD